MDIGFAPNYTNLFLIDITPEADDPTWKRLGQGITSVEPDNSEKTDDNNYMDGEGATDTDVTGVQLGYKVKGDRRYGNEAQDFVAGRATETGAKRRSSLRHIAPNGKIIEGAITMTGIVDGGGDANEKGSFEFSAKLSGRPIVSGVAAKVLPETITATPVTVAVGATTKVAPTVTPTGAPASAAYAVEDTDIATVDDDGTVRGVKAGTTHLSIKSMVLPSVTSTVAVTVSAG